MDILEIGTIAITVTLRTVKSHNIPRVKEYTLFYYLTKSISIFLLIIFFNKFQITVLQLLTVLKIFRQVFTFVL